MPFSARIVSVSSPFTNGLALGIALLSLPALEAANPQFEREILPILARHCHGCHGAKRPQRNLDLRSIQSLVDGGLSGVIAVPGKPEQSYLYQMVRRGAMPPSVWSNDANGTLKRAMAGCVRSDSHTTRVRPE